MVNAQLVVTALKVRKALLTIWALLILKTLLIVNVPPLVKALLTEKRKNKGSDLSSEVILSQRRARNCWHQKKKIRKVFKYREL